MAARKPSDRSHGSDDDIADLNLVPIMAIMVILVPMLIYMFTFHQIRVQRVTAPRRGTGAKKATDEKKEKELNLTVVIKQDKGFLITWEEQLMPEAQSLPLIPMIQVGDDMCGDPNDKDSSPEQGCKAKMEGCFCYDYATLYNELVKKKMKFSNPEKPERRVNITADLNVPWGVVSRAIDAVSCRLEQESYTDYKEYLSAAPKKGEKRTVPGVDTPVDFCEELFPQVVFAMSD